MWEVKVMRIFFKTILLIVGVALFIWGLKPLGLLAVGDKADAIITEVVESNLNTEMKGGRRSINKPTGFFTVKTTVRYRFDVHPTPLEQLKRLSDTPLAADVVGSDTLHGKTRFPDIPMYTRGDRIGVIFLKPMPSFNAAYQPNTMMTFGILRLVGGLALFAWGLLISSIRKRGREENSPQTQTQVKHP
jgi:hypothetical protein